MHVCLSIQWVLSFFPSWNTHNYAVAAGESIKPNTAWKLMVNRNEKSISKSLQPSGFGWQSHPVSLHSRLLSRCVRSKHLYTLFLAPRDFVLALIWNGFLKRIRVFAGQLFAACATWLSPLFGHVDRWQLLHPFEVISVPKSQIRRRRRLFHMPMRLKAPDCARNCLFTRPSSRRSQCAF